MSLRTFSLLAVVVFFALISTPGTAAQEPVAESPAPELQALAPATTIQQTDAEKEDDVVQDLTGEFDDQAFAPALAPADGTAAESPGESNPEGNILETSSARQFQINWVLGAGVGLLALLV